MLQLTEVDSKLIRFCDSCLKFLQKAVKFREKCISSFEYLSNKSSVLDDNFDVSDEILNVKSEESVFVQELEAFPVQAIINEVFLDPMKFPVEEEENTQEQRQIFQCDVCFEMFKDKKKFKSHLKREKRKTSDVLLFCDICGYSSKRKPSLIGHMQNKQ